jgi:hypothetical protein
MELWVFCKNVDVEDNLLTFKHFCIGFNNYISPYDNSLILDKL